MNIVFSGPSGSGKSTLTEILIKDIAYKKFITCTTRNMRENEKDGFDYYFLDKEKFLYYVENKMMHNVREYGGNYYGSFEKDINNIETNSHVIFQLTPDRALEMKKNNPNTLLILVLSPNINELANRRKDRNQKRIEDDIKNLNDARNYDYILINDDLSEAIFNIKKIIDSFELGNFEKKLNSNNEIIDDFIEQLTNSNFTTKVEAVFNKDVAHNWDDKSRFVTYHGIKNPITSEVFENLRNGITIADIGCGTGKLIEKIDKRTQDSLLIGLDISNDMINQATSKKLSDNNIQQFVNDDFMKYKFQNKFDIIIFSYVLHHMSNPIEALQKAKKFLNDNGNILFSVPGINYLSETFERNTLSGRYTLDEIDEVLSQAGLYPISACRNKFLMTFNSYELYIEYLKSIGTYQKINDYTNECWSDEFNNEILSKFNNSDYITGEYLTYNCKDKVKVLIKR